MDHTQSILFHFVPATSVSEISLKDHIDPTLPDVEKRLAELIHLATGKEPNIMIEIEVISAFNESSSITGYYVFHIYCLLISIKLK